MRNYVFPVFYNNVNLIKFSCKNESTFSKISVETHADFVLFSKSYCFFFIGRNLDQKFLPGSKYLKYMIEIDRLFGLVVRVSGYRYRGLGFDSRRYQIF